MIRTSKQFMYYKSRFPANPTHRKIGYRMVVHYYYCISCGPFYVSKSKRLYERIKSLTFCITFDFNKWKSSINFWWWIIHLLVCSAWIYLCGRTILIYNIDNFETFLNVEILNFKFYNKSNTKLIRLSSHWNNSCPNNENQYCIIN